ncbi:MAG: hypothetical protein M5U32_14335 [Myxococcota bacterium]|nr:hypothetical protein [Myxococcota bacterium]
MTHDPPRDQPGDLRHDDTAAVLHLERHREPDVLALAARVERREKAAAAPLDRPHPPAHRRTIHVHVEHRQEDADAQTLAMGLVLDLVDGENAAVGGRHDISFAPGEAAYGIAEERDTESGEGDESGADPRPAEQDQAGAREAGRARKGPGVGDHGRRRTLREDRARLRRLAHRLLSSSSGRPAASPAATA